MFPAASPEPAAVTPAVGTGRADRIGGVVIVLAYVAVEIALAIGHQPWRDEAQAWLWAQSLSNFGEFLAIPGEGHPPLWYWLLRGLSMVLDFSQARYLTLGVAILNAVLLARLLRTDVLLLTLMLCTHVVLQYWGYHFRPYGLTFTAILTALLLDRAGRPLAATWVMALACGLHFYAGFVFGFWLLVQWSRGIRITQLAGPALLGALFGVSALVSGMGNPEGVPTTSDMLDIIFFNLAWPVPWPFLRTWPVAIVTIALLTYGLWNQRFILATLLALTLAFALGSAVFYGQSPWHSAFVMMMTFVAFMLADKTSHRWVLIVLLMPQAVAGIAVTKNRMEYPVWTKTDLYATVVADAGPGFDPSTQLVAWQDFNLSTAAAIHGISYISGNNGQRLGPVDWRHRVEDAVDPVLGTTPTPYWLVCGDCAPALAAITAAGLKPTELASSVNFDDGPMSAYRIDASL